MADHMTAELLTAMADQLGRAVEQVWHECECDICGQCGKMPRECSGTRCAETCQCSVCDHCIASSLIAEHKATVARPVTYGTAEQLRAEVRNVALYARQKCADAVDIDALHFALIAIANSLDQAAARLSGMAAVPVDHVVVPRVPTEAMWNGLARSLIMAFDFDCKSPNKLYRFLEQRGDTVPQWMREEGDMDVLDKVAPKGTRAVLIYRAMVEEFLAAAPEPPHV